AADAPRAHEARVGALARGGLPLQQPAARGALPDDPVGGDLPDPDAALRGDDEDDRAAVLRLLPARVRAAAAAPDGDRAADRMAADVGARARADAALADRGRARHRWSADRIRRRLVAARPDRVHVLRVRPDDDRRRARARHTRDRLARRARGPEP